MFYKKMTDKYMCDDCKKTFAGKDVKLEALADNINIFGQMIFVVDKDDKIRGTSTAKAKEGDRTIHCPHCGYTHLFGFTKV